MKWQESMERAHNIGECIVAKQRHGPIGTVKMYFDPNYTRFSDLDPSYYGDVNNFDDE
jgi:replicative DNA helicase